MEPESIIGWCRVTSNIQPVFQAVFCCWPPETDPSFERDVIIELFSLVSRNNGKGKLFSICREGSTFSPGKRNVLDNVFLRAWFWILDACLGPAAVAEYHGLGGLNSKHLFRIVLEAGRAAWSVLGEGSLPGYVLTWPFLSVCTQERSLSAGAWIPSLGPPSHDLI